MEPGIRCRNCQTWNRPEARFCAGCGAGLSVDVPPPTLYKVAPRPRTAGSRSPGWLALTSNVLAWVVGLAAVALICLALPVLNASGRLLDGALYKESLRNQDVYRRAPDLFAEQMALSQTRLGQSAHIDFKGVGPADWKFLAQELFPPEWVQTQVERLIDEMFAAARPGVTPPALKISLADVTQRLGGESGMRIYKQVIQTKRACNFDDFFEIVAWIDQDTTAHLPICNIPPDLSEFAALIGGYDDGDAMIRDLLKELPGQLPKEIALSDFMTLRMDRAANLQRLGRIVGWGCLALAGLALLLTFIAPLGRTLTGGLLLWGLPLAVAGVVGLLEAAALPWIVGGLIVGGFKGALAPGLTRVLLQMGDTVAKSSAVALAWQAGGLLVVGMILCGLGAGVWGLKRLRG